MVWFRLQSYLKCNKIRGTKTLCSSIDFVDNNECSDSTLNTCAVNAECQNKDGTYCCVCNPGFIGDGKLCVGEDFLYFYNWYTISYNLFL